MPTGVYKHSEKQNQNHSKKMKEYYRKGNPAGMKGKHQSEEAKKKISESNIKSGRIPPSNLGKKHSEEHRKRIGLANKGKIRTEETKEKLSLAHIGKKTPWNSGEKCHLWRGGKTPLNKQIRRSIEYKIWRRAVFERDNFTCVWCKERGVELNADHIKPFAYYPELRFAIDNGRTLCVSCHRKTDTYGTKTRRLCN